LVPSCRSSRFRRCFGTIAHKPTPLNLTNHSYFDLAGHGDILDHELTFFAELFTPVDAGLIPTGELRAVAGTPLDFRHPRRIRDSVEANDEQMRFAGGYDHNFVVLRTSGDAEPLDIARSVFSHSSLRCPNTLRTERESR